MEGIITLLFYYCFNLDLQEPLYRLNFLFFLYLYMKIHLPTPSNPCSERV